MINLLIKNDAELRKAIKNMTPARIINAAAKVLNEEAETIMTASKKLVPVDLGGLKNSGTVKTVKDGTKVTVTMGYGTKYAVYIHEGTGPAVGRPPFFPPIDVIKAWAKRHGIPENAAFAIARAIGQRGLKGRKFLSIPANEAIKGINKRLAERMREELLKPFGR